jgi:allantoinase
MLGYGSKAINPLWRGDGKFVVNYEEGAENCILHGDKTWEAFLSKIVGAPVLPGVRHMNLESIYEYDSRRGFWQ